MKTNLKLFVFTTLILVAPLFANATNPEAKATLRTGMYFSKDGKLNVFVENQSLKTAKIVVKDSHNQTVFEKRTNRSSSLTGLKFDLDALPDGQYVIEVSNDKEKIEQTINLETPKKERTLVAMK